MGRRTKASGCGMLPLLGLLLFLGGIYFGRSSPPGPNSVRNQPTATVPSAPAYVVTSTGAHADGQSANQLLSAAPDDLAASVTETPDWAGTAIEPEEVAASLPAPRPEAATLTSAESTNQQACAPEIVNTFEGTVISVADGDTLSVMSDASKRVVVRLEGIDAPERGQEHGTKATDALKKLVFNKHVTIKATGTDRYQRTLGYVLLGGMDVNQQLVDDGWAWHFTKYNCEDRFSKAEVAAKAARRGLWAHENVIPPWEFREIKAAAPKVAPLPKRPTGSAPIVFEPVERAKPAPVETRSVGGSYWLNTKTGKRHNSGCRWYGKTGSGRACDKSEGSACGICGG